MENKEVTILPRWNKMIGRKQIEEINHGKENLSGTRGGGGL